MSCQRSQLSFSMSNPIIENYPMSKLFGERLREERKKQHMTVNAVAQNCGISRSYITLIENGRRAPGKRILAKIAGALHVKVSVVLNWYLEDVAERIQKELKTS